MHELDPPDDQAAAPAAEAPAEDGGDAERGGELAWRQFFAEVRRLADAARERRVPTT